jgi:hypothetical protein
MPDNPNRNIYDIELARQYVVVDYGPSLNFLQDLANYGSHLILRCFDSSQREIEDVVLVATLLKHVVTMLDGIIVLLNQGSTLPAELVLRSMFEARMNATWMLKKDTRKRAKQYAVWHWRREMDSCKVSIKGTAEYLKPEKWFKSKLKANFLAVRDAEEKPAKENVKKILDVLSSAEFKDINDEFEKLRLSKKGKRGTHDAHWYSLFSGPRSFRVLCEELERHGHYDVLYGDASTIAHATTFMRMVSHETDTLIIENIRNPNDMQRLFIYAAAEAISTYGLFLEKYRHGETPAFKRRFQEEWRQPFMSIPKTVVERGKAKVY